MKKYRFLKTIYTSECYVYLIPSLTMYLFKDYDIGHVSFTVKFFIYRWELMFKWIKK